MKKNKIILVSFIIMCLILVLTGCTENKDNSNNVNNTTNNTTKNTSNSKNNKKEENDVESVNFVENAKKQVETMPEKGETIAIMHIKDYGDIKIKFFNEVAPKAVENFVTHSKNGYYNGVTFHRVINDFMIQGGDPTATGAGGKSIWNKNFEDEFSYDLVPYRGALCMANAGSNTNGSQFFIEQAGYDEETGKMLKQYGYPEKLIEAYKVYGGSMHLFCKHTVFGQVIDGMNVVDKIAETEVDSNDKPVNAVVIDNIEIVEYNS